jgi:hypothetical protein
MHTSSPSKNQKEKANSAIELETHFNDQNKYYRTGFVEKNTASIHEEIQVRLNTILQSRKQITENLSGSQISYVLDFFIEAAFLAVITEQGLPDEQKIESLKSSFSGTLDYLLDNRRRLLSTRFANEEIYDTVVKLPFEVDIKTFIKNFLSLKLSRGVYLDFLDDYYRVLATGELTNSISQDYVSFYKGNYLYFKNLLLGNYLRFIMAETNRSMNQFKDYLSPAAKEDYFCGLVLKVLEVIDKYDSYKGTLTSYIENWFKDYKTVFKKNHVDSVFREVALSQDNENHVFSKTEDREEEYYDPQTEVFDLRTALLDTLVSMLNRDSQFIIETVKKYQESLPELFKLLDNDCDDWIMQH